ncbi:MAG TPA: DUF3891 family protein [Acidisarcina sp.]
MIRSRSQTGWWLVTHVDHAHLAAAFAEHWGNENFLPPEPRAQVLMGIASHDDGWAARDAQPCITRAGEPAAFSSELVGRYSAFEEIDLEDYLAVRSRAVQLVAAVDPYAAMLVSMHTYDLLTTRADRSSIAPEKLPLLDAFLVEQKRLQGELYEAILAAPGFKPGEVVGSRIEEHFRLLQACDNLSLLGCVAYSRPATLLHALPLRNGRSEPVKVEVLADRHFRLTPYPFDSGPLMVEYPARHVEGEVFKSVEEFRHRFTSAVPIRLSVTVSA